MSFWLPGQFGSLAAVPQKPGWTIGTIDDHTSVDSGGDITAARPRFNPTVNVNLNANLTARPDLVFIAPNYVFATPGAGRTIGRGHTGAFGRSTAAIDGTLMASVGNVAVTRVTRSGTISDKRWGFADFYPLASRRWNSGVNNFMTYVTGDIPVGTYDPSNLANIGIGHGAIDGGGIYISQHAERT